VFYYWVDEEVLEFEIRWECGGVRRNIEFHQKDGLGSVGRVVVIDLDCRS